ncbi:hypothetical protein HNR31_001696 [Anoxybacillus caldiproteolyticus]|uniref:Uncharacterized protein n=1 Tax=Thermaerobacillus caldiproteolyticus TaxID=247480 RepID=A0A7V9Z6G6_9BACL|nr:hypothetical protein [Anoxybacillus caldiproteolyticus]
MRKNSTYCDACRELVGGANKRLAIWNGLSSIQAELGVGLDVCLALQRCHAKIAWNRAIVREVQ